MAGWLPRQHPAPHGAILVIVATLAGTLAWPHLTAASSSDIDYDCRDFDSQQDAQAFYEASGGPLYDPFNLDDDEDGFACEEWARDYQQSASKSAPINGKDGIDTDCADFATQKEAQRYFLADGGSIQLNVDHLDPNHDGIACEPGEPG
jgi:hypothetical protein